jgi:hypothetical protein
MQEDHEEAIVTVEDRITLDAAEHFPDFNCYNIRRYFFLILF